MSNLTNQQRAYIRCEKEERRQRSYHTERTGSRQISEVKPCRVSIVPGWVTAWEVEMLLALFHYFIIYFVSLGLLFLVVRPLPGLGGSERAGRTAGERGS